MLNLGLYRKAIAVFLTQAVGILAMYAPGIAEHIGPETIQLGAFLASTAVALIVSDKLDGFKVNDLAKALMSAAADLGRATPAVATAQAVAGTGKNVTPATAAPADAITAVVLLTEPPATPPENVVTLRPAPVPEYPAGV